MNRRNSKRGVSTTQFLKHALRVAEKGNRPTAFIVAGHNGSGKSTLWYDHLAERLKMPLINADRLLTSILPPSRYLNDQLPAWARQLRDDDERWQRLTQEGIQAFTGLIMAKRMPFAFETVFSHWHQRSDGSYESKADVILKLQEEGYFVVLLFVGLASVDMSALRVLTRQQQGGHAVPMPKLKERYPRTQKAIAYAAPLADMTLMFDNSRNIEHAFSLVRVQQSNKVLFDCRNQQQCKDKKLRKIAMTWLPKVASSFE